jgi:DNA processing protein
MAYGVDIAAHKAALDNNLETAAILATGLKDIYPVAHTRYASRIASKGALISEYPFIKEGFKYNFLRRNRIIAGICEAIIVIESAEKGGAIITAKLANSYTREVYALPGRISDPMSKGCNKLISNNMARIFTSVSDMLEEMRWITKRGKKNNSGQQSLFTENSPQKEKILLALKSHNELNIDNIAHYTSLPVKEISAAITELEIENRISGSPGGLYSLN